MDAPNDGGPAFPVMVNQIDEPGSSEIVLQSEGMSYRRWLAGMAMQGMLSCQDFMNEVTKNCGDKTDARSVVAAWAWKQADAMIDAESNG